MKRTQTRESQILRSARKKSGLSQLQIATEVGVQVRQYQRLEYGERPFSSVNIRVGLTLCRILQLDPFDMVFGERSNPNPNVQLHSKSQGKKGRHDDSWNGHGAHPDPTANQAIYNVSVEWNRKRKLAIRLRLNGEEPDPELFMGFFRRLLTDPLEELMELPKGKEDG